MAQKDKYFSMRIEDGTRQALAEIAARSNKTASAMVAHLVLKEAKRLGVKVGAEPANNDKKKENGDG
ncbi:hypothetical protein AEP_03900 [Curvibacter sp. AEP1-3]|uniref:hypothetical protein n=1 Tax=Curvibacter sp. AEP1-3 TaxID=1844971 RepID=UPI000B3CC7ED|nr:hypothetical protein [Curvibacter sp. AEP1-3]ARV20817.1 hypothetical protein AEP_03900 [Curvibacter sp. AEP1-3]